MIKTKHSFTDDHCLQLDTASLRSTASHSDYSDQLIIDIYEIYEVNINNVIYIYEGKGLT